MLILIEDKTLSGTEVLSNHILHFIILLVD